MTKTQWNITGIFFPFEKIQGSPKILVVILKASVGLQIIQKARNLGGLSLIPQRYNYQMHSCEENRRKKRLLGKQRQTKSNTHTLFCLKSQQRCDLPVFLNSIAPRGICIWHLHPHIHQCLANCPLTKDLLTFAGA